MHSVSWRQDEFYNIWDKLIMSASVFADIWQVTPAARLGGVLIRDNRGLQRQTQPGIFKSALGAANHPDATGWVGKSCVGVTAVISWDTRLATSISPQIQKHLEILGALKCEEWERPFHHSFAQKKKEKKNLFELNFNVLDLIYSHSRQARLACSLSSRSCSFHCDKNQRPGFKCKCSHSGAGFVEKAETEQRTEGHGSSSRGNAHSTSKWCLFVSNPHRPTEPIFSDEWVYFLVRQHLHVLTFSLWWDHEEED